jgi:hypothetical protein
MALEPPFALTSEPFALKDDPFARTGRVVGTISTVQDERTCFT